MFFKGIWSSEYSEIANFLVVCQDIIEIFQSKPYMYNLVMGLAKNPVIDKVSTDTFWLIQFLIQNLMEM